MIGRAPRLRRRIQPITVKVHRHESELDEFDGWLAFNLPLALEHAHCPRRPARRGQVLGLCTDEWRDIAVCVSEFGLTLEIRVVPLLFRRPIGVEA